MKTYVHSENGNNIILLGMDIVLLRIKISDFLIILKEPNL